MKNNILIGCMIMGFVLATQQLGWLDWTKIVPGPTPDVIPAPDPKPDPIPVPDPVPVPDPIPDPTPVPVIVFPDMPDGFAARTEGIYTAFKNCNSKVGALAFAQAYKDWAGTLMTDASKNINSGEKVKLLNKEIISWLLKDSNLEKSFCPGLGMAIEASLVETLKLNTTFTDEDRQNASNLFKAISAQSYRAYKEMK